MALILTKSSAREARKCKVSDQDLLDAIQRARRGLIDAQIASMLIKQEVARPPEGRKTACRAIVAMRKGTDFAVIMHIYAKSEKANLTLREAEGYSELSKTVLDLTKSQLDELIRSRGWKKIGNGPREE